MPAICPKIVARTHERSKTATLPDSAHCLVPAHGKTRGRSVYLTSLLTWDVLGQCVGDPVQQLVATSHTICIRLMSSRNFQAGQTGQIKLAKEDPLSAMQYFFMLGVMENRNIKLHKPFNHLLLLLTELLELRHSPR